MDGLPVRSGPCPGPRYGLAEQEEEETIQTATLQSICLPSEDVVAREIEGRLVIVPLVNGMGDADQHIYTLSETGRAIWHQLDGEKTLGQIAAELAERFSHPQQAIERDVLGLAAEMLRRGICWQFNGALAQPHKRKRAVDDSEAAIARQAPVPTDSRGEEPSEYVRRGGELRLSNPGQLALLKGMQERGVPLRTLVRGFSMSPFIRDLDVLTISPLSDQPPRTGEVVAFSHPDNGRLAIHRIIKKTASGWLLKGDNCQETDGVVAIDKIIGRVVRIERNQRKMTLGLGASGRLIAFLNGGRGLEYIKKLLFLPRRSANSTLRCLQGLALYRKLAGRFVPPVVISAADEKDLAAVHRRFNPGRPPIPQKADPNVTHFVAATGRKVVGFAQLVYHPEEHSPWAGYWLFSLHVWGLYRGMGIGEKLVRRCIEAAQGKGASELRLLVYEDNICALALDRKLGFVPVTLPALEPRLEAEKEKTGRRRMVMQKNVEENQ